MIAYLADNTLTFAGGSVLGPHVLTAGFTLDLLAPACGGELMALGTVLSSAHRRATCRAEVHVVDDSGARRRCAAAQGTIVMAHAS